MILIDKVRGWHDRGLTAELTVRADNLFFVAGKGVAAHVAIEWMAQTCAAFVGAEALAANEPVRIGFLLGTRGFAADPEWFSEGDRIEVSTLLSFREGDMAVFDCTVVRDGKVEATAALTVYQPADLIKTLADQGVAVGRRD